MRDHVFWFTTYFCCFFTECITSVVMGNLQYWFAKLTNTLFLFLLNYNIFLLFFHRVPVLLWGNLRYWLAKLTILVFFIYNIFLYVFDSVVPVLLWGIYDIDSLNWLILYSCLCFFIYNIFLLFFHRVSHQWNYTQHKKSVFSVAFVDSLRLVATCDSTVHVSYG